MFVSRQAIKIKTKKRIYFTQNEISISSVTTTFEMMTEQGEEKPKNRTAGTTETGRIQTPGLLRVATTIYQRDLSRPISSEAMLYCYSYHG